MAPGVFYCLIQREGSPEILILSQFLSYPEAENAALQELRKSAKKTGWL